MTSIAESLIFVHKGFWPANQESFCFKRLCSQVVAPKGFVGYWWQIRYQQWGCACSLPNLWLAYLCFLNSFFISFRLNCSFSGGSSFNLFILRKLCASVLPLSSRLSWIYLVTATKEHFQKVGSLHRWLHPYYHQLSLVYRIYQSFGSILVVDFDFTEVLYRCPSEELLLF